MKTIFSTIFILLAVFPGLEATAQQSVWTVHSSVCEAINPAQSQRMEWRETGLVNRDPSRTLWVMCPVMSKFFNSPYQYSIITLLVANDSSKSMEVQCILRVADVDTMDIMAYAKTQTVVAGGAIDFLWEFEDKPFVLPSVACNLPPNGVIAGILSGFLDD
jgi:hypothetical protein